MIQNSAICASYFMNVFTALKGTFFSFESNQHRPRLRVT